MTRTFRALQLQRLEARMSWNAAVLETELKFPRLSTAVADNSL
jgi:hypothetical protein